MRLLITGTTGGIGTALEHEATRAGHTVTAINRADWDKLRPLAAASAPFDAVIFATGMCPIKPLGSITDEVFMETMNVNCGYFMRLVREIVKRRLYSSAGCTMIAISSVSASVGWAGGAAYCASKGALSALCRALDAELAPRHIHVTALEPSYVKTRMFDDGAGRMGVPEQAAIKPVDFAWQILARISHQVPKVPKINIAFN